MFTGLVEMLADVREVVEEPPGRRLRIAAGVLAADAVLGESIAVSGCCLTVVGIDRQVLDFQAGPETLSRTTLGTLKAGSQVNLERSLMLGDRLGGHLVTGHIDAVGTLAARDDYGDWATLWFEVPQPLMRQIAGKGSVAIDGASLTVVDVQANRFSVQLIPHTLQVTTLGQLRSGQPVNIETDLLAKYVERQLQHGEDR